MKVTNNAPPNPQVIEQAKNIERAKDSTKLKDKDSKTAVSNRDPMVSISDEAQLMRKAVDRVHETPDIRLDKIEALKKKIQAGTYHVESRDIADRLLQEHLNTDFGKNNL